MHAGVAVAAAPVRTSAPCASQRLLVSPQLRVLSSARLRCVQGLYSSSRSLVSRLEGLYGFLYEDEPLESDESDSWELLAVVSRRRHQETAFKSLLEQLQELLQLPEESFKSGALKSAEDTLQMLLQAPRQSREVHWMHLQIDALLKGDADNKGWQESWQEDYREQIQCFEEFLESSDKLRQELARMDTSDTMELVMALQYERRKLSDANDTKEFMPEEQELLDHAISKISRIGKVEVATVPEWFVPRYELVNATKVELFCVPACLFVWSRC
ncbi:Leucine-rich repeat serine/threonine-protein kinase 2 [Phytophthora boehmeriae]|uniref:Leucine-rich repeat serine/threonine-protein kinase 2 n=1 Tax=Phytophthora boehmeriae TaxID=109152 RepID=A0A8T1VXJ3_9STRA|nr:Leucine-rich repeat serine/threonine-protein kinase 2 [Phytophthora boehmeriae]